MARYRGYRSGGGRSVSSEVPRATMTPVVKGFGKINSTGVLPAGQTQPQVISEVEFSITISRSGRTYQGEIYLVNYTTKEKINSNKLIYFDQSSEIEIITIFIVESGNGGCAYELIVTISPANCTMNCNGKLFAYVPAIYNQGLNIGGNLESGEILICTNDYCCEYGAYGTFDSFATNGTIISYESSPDSECTFYDTSDSNNSCCSNVNGTSTTTTTTTANSS